MFIVKYYVLAALAALAMTVWVDNLYFKLFFAWICVSLSLVSTAYIFQAPGIFRKKTNGSIPFYIRWLFIPFLLGAQLYNAWSRKNDSVPPIQKIRDNLFLAARLFPSDVDTLKNEGITAILDATAEFDGLDWTAESEHLQYLNIPVLDHQSPTASELQQAINWIQNQIDDGGSVVVHCALGRGRSVLIMTAYLMSLDKNLSAEEAVAEINTTRQTARLNSHQLKKLKTIHQAGELHVKEHLAIVANPVAGGGKWSEYKEEVLQRLSPHFDLTVYETTEDCNAQKMALQALEEGADSIMACGGDGTLTEAASALVGTDYPLGIMPLGTANAFSHALYGVSTKIIPVETACDAIIAGLTMKIDTATCNDELALMVVGIGFEQEMISQADRESKNESGQMAYLGALYDAIETNQSSTLTIQLDDADPFTIETGSLIIANAAPSTTVLAQGAGNPDVKDGLLDITWLPKTESTSETIINLAELAMRSLSESKPDSQHHEDAIQHRHASSITIESDSKGPLKYVIDGENREAEKIRIEVNPLSLTVYCLPY
ncbi:diacylglycerol kinase family protein [Aliiglaciecola litoralis]|uniref:Diacylglycerol kinase family protein n=1 Tax=Aliiglaciecola litoralis TaxID=582857 RepID=A0ABP3WQ93_9ALTE